MPTDLGALSAAAVTIGLFHTLCGPDHYLPFVAMARAGKWSLRKTIVVTLLCGVGHVASSVALGFVGIAFGVVLFKLEKIESVRGDIAGWLLTGFGLAYFVWGAMQAIRSRPHAHLHAHGDGTVHAHLHGHEGEHLHAHDLAATREQPPVGTRPALTPWMLFTIFLFGPCEPLIPLVMYPAARADLAGVAAVTALFALATLAAMTSMVVLMRAGAGMFRFQPLARYGHALAGLAVLCCGMAVKFGL